MRIPNHMLNREVKNFNVKIVKITWTRFLPSWFPTAGNNGGRWDLKFSEAHAAIKDGCMSIQHLAYLQEDTFCNFISLPAWSPLPHWPLSSAIACDLDQPATRRWVTWPLDGSSLQTSGSARQRHVAWWFIRQNIVSWKGWAGSNPRFTLPCLWIRCGNKNANADLYAYEVTLFQVLLYGPVSCYHTDYGEFKGT